MIQKITKVQIILLEVTVAVWNAEVGVEVEAVARVVVWVFNVVLQVYIVRVAARTHGLLRDNLQNSISISKI